MYIYSKGDLMTVIKNVLFTYIYIGLNNLYLMFCYSFHSSVCDMM